jgi:copper homeostasis protein
MGIAVEVCAGSAGEIEAAHRSGADSVEVCTWLAAGGVTPSWGLVSSALVHPGLRTRVLVRPGPGGFHFGKLEKQVILADLDHFVGSGVHGIVVGALMEDGSVDHAFIREVLGRCKGVEVTFHRAIDQANDLRSAFDACLDLGIQRVLTSGGRSLALDGRDQLAWMVDRAAGRVIVAAAGGISPNTVVELVQHTGVPEVHFAAQRQLAGDNTLASLASKSAPLGALEADEDKIAAMIGALKSLSRP